MKNHLIQNGVEKNSFSENVHLFAEKMKATYFIS